MRIFTPRREIAFASHPGIGSAHALLECGVAQPRHGLLWQECGAGLSPVRVVPAWVVRAFPAGVGITEDPASGAANGLIAACLAHAEPAGPFARGYTVSQRREIGPDAELIIRMDGGDVWRRKYAHHLARNAGLGRRLISI